MENEENPKYWRQVLAILAACGTIFSVGLNIAWPSPCLKPLMDSLDITNRTGSYITIASPFGNVVGSGFSLLLLQLIGSKDAIFFSVVLQTVFWFVIAYFPPPWFIYSIGRIGTGLGESVCNIAMPTYIAEVASPRMKEILLCLIPIVLIFGNLIVNVVGLHLGISHTSYVCMNLVIVWSIFTFISPSTPSFWIRKKNKGEALKSLQYYRVKHEVESDYALLVEEIERQKLEPNSMRHLFRIQGYRQAMFIMTILKIAHLFSGYPATIIYTHQIFIRAHVNIPEDTAACIFIVLHLIFTVCGIYLNLTYKRKKFLMISFIGSTVFQFLVAIYFYYDELTDESVEEYRWGALLGMSGYICFYSMGMHIVPNLLFFDLFRDSIKSKAFCLLNMLQGAIFFTISKSFQEITDLCGQFIMFLIYTMAASFGIIFVHFCVPETHGKTFDEIQEMLQENGFRYILDSSYRY